MSRADRGPLIDMVSAAAAQSGSLPPGKLALFAAREGRSYANELMVVGRALNGGAVKFHLADVIDTPSCEDLVERALKNAQPDHGDPLQWVNECWGAHPGKSYNARRSQFWNVIRGVSRQLVPTAEENQWPSGIVWSNLYKLSPHNRGNPNAALRQAQRALCAKILSAELELWRPRRLLFLTGLSWARPFLDELGCTFARAPSGEPVEAAGSGPHGLKLVVAPHPQGKARKPLVAAICSAFSR